MSFCCGWKRPFEPKMTNAAIPNVRPTTTNRPIEAGFAFLLIRRIQSGRGMDSSSYRCPRCKLLRKFAASEESFQFCIGGMLQQFLRISLCSHCLGFGIEEDRVVGDREDAG